MEMTEKQVIQGHEKRQEAAFSFASLCNFMFIMIVSKVLVFMPLIGGALYLSARATLMLVQSFSSVQSKTMAKALKWAVRGLLFLALLACAFFLGLFPISPQSPRLWIIFGLVLAGIIREIFTKKALRYYVNNQWRKRNCILAIVSIHLVALVAMAFLLTYSLELETALFVLAGFGVCGLLEMYDQWRNRANLLYTPAVTDLEKQQMRELMKNLREVNAYHAFNILYNLYVVGLYITIVLASTYIVISAQSLLIYMLISFFCMILSRKVAGLAGRKIKRTGRDPAFEGAVGTLCWLAGMLLFTRQFTVPGKELNAYIALGLSYFGMSLCAESLNIFEQDMDQVIAFHLGEVNNAYMQLHKAIKEFAMALGEVIVLVLLLILAVIEGLKLPQTPQEMVMAFEPLLIFPVVLIIAAVLIGVLQFPISEKYRQKLKRLLQIKEAGNENRQLDEQLQTVVVKKHKRPFGIKVLITLARPLYRHKVVGKENVPQNADGELVFICNHGKIYGPVVTNLYLPFYIRPWSISDLIDDVDEAAAYIYKYNISKIKWLPDRVKRFIARRIAAPLSLWLFRSMEAIPVYRNKLRELIKTFRLSIDAMIAEDNLLIFPENPDAETLEIPGYVTKGVGDFYTGFTMIAPTLYNKTGKIAKFIPIYASKDGKTISIGEPVVYDPDRQPTEEKLRIVEELQGKMNHMAIELEKAEKASKSKKKAGKKQKSG